MDIEEIKTLTDLMIDNDLSEIMIRDGEKRIVLRRGVSGALQQFVPAPVIASRPADVPVPPDPALAGQVTDAQDAPPPAEGKDLAQIASPMVGTFYAASEPDSPPFVQVGDEVGPDTVVCIIEAMKVFNEIKAEISGVVESIQIENGKPVEFGQTIMTVRVGP